MSRSVTVRATRIAVSTASPPDVVKASRSLPVIAHAISATVAEQVALDADREAAVELLA